MLKITTRAIIALVVIIGGFLLIALGIDSFIQMILNLVSCLSL